MNAKNCKTVCLMTALIVVCLIAGCEEAVKTSQERIDLGTTIGSLSEIFAVDAIKVEGYGIVDGLDGTGSSECPPQVRDYIKQYILQNLPEQKMNVDDFINSLNTAVVIIDGIMPAAVSKNQYFDVRVSPLPGTQTTSLEGGWLYGAELKAAGTFGLTIKVLAEAEGPIFVDTLDPSASKKVGYILAGGTVLDEHKVSLALRSPDYKTAAAIRNKLNERFGPETATAISSGQIELKIPNRYKEQKPRFLSIVKAMYLTSTAEVTEQRINAFIQQLATSEDKYTSEVALEAIGNESLKKLEALLNSSNPQVRLGAATCALNLGSDRGLDVLREIALDSSSPYQIDALSAIAAAADRNDASAISRMLLREGNATVRLAAYEQLRKLDDVAISRKLVARNFYLEQITQTPYKSIFVSRSGQPRIALFGVPIRCRENIFIQSTDGNITINAPPGQQYISIMRKHPKRPNVIVQLKSSYELSDIIKKLCEEPVKEKGEGPAGLNVSYGEMIALLKQMCEKGAVEAEFQAGPMPKIAGFIKK